MNEQFQKVYSQTEKAMIDAKYSPLHKKIQYQILLNKFARETAYENIKNDPVNYLSSSFKNMFRMWFATYNQSFESEKLKIAGFDLMRFIIMLPGIIMLLFGIIGCLLRNSEKDFAQSARFFDFSYSLSARFYTDDVLASHRIALHYSGSAFFSGKRGDWLLLSFYIG